MIQTTVVTAIVNYETIRIKSESTPTTIKLSKSISNIHLSTAINTSIQVPQSTITNNDKTFTPHQTTSLLQTKLTTTTPPSFIKRCSTCQINLSTQYFKPLIAQPQKFDKTCPHRYCSTCFNTLTTTSNNNQCSWDGYPMVDKMYRKRHDIDQIYTCQLCQLYQFESTS